MVAQATQKETNVADDGEYAVPMEQDVSIKCKEADQTSTQELKVSSPQESFYTSLNENREPENVYEPLNNPPSTVDTSASSHHTMRRDDESLTYMSLKDNTQPENVYQSLQM